MAKYRREVRKDSNPVTNINIPQNTLFSIIAAVVTIGIAWGIIKAKVASVIDEQRRLGSEVGRVKDALTSTREEFTHKLQENYVTYNHFGEVINALRQENIQIRSDQKEIRDDLKKILNMLATIRQGRIDS